jgi:hypothetical protein
MDIDKVTGKMLIVQKNNHLNELTLINLKTQKSQLIDQQEQAYWGLKWNHDNDSFWLGNESLRLMSLSGHSETVHLPMGFIPDIDLNPKTLQLAHSEGLVNVNLYNLDLTDFNAQTSNRSRQLSSSARTDILPSISNDGDQTAFVSYQRRSMDGLKHIEIWLKHRHKKAASLLANLQEDMKPSYLLWSPNDENLLLGDHNQNLYLINTFSKHMVPIISGFQGVNRVNWTKDGKQITFETISEDKIDLWKYDLQLATTQLVEQKNILKKHSKDVNSIEITPDMIKDTNPSFKQYTNRVADFLNQHILDDSSVYNLYPSLALYRPAVIEIGIYYVVKQGHQLKLYLYHFENQKNVYIANIGNHEQDINLLLNISASQDGKQIVFSKIEGLETDILVQRKVKK